MGFFILMAPLFIPMLLLKSDTENVQIMFLLLKVHSQSHLVDTHETEQTNMKMYVTNT